MFPAWTGRDGYPLTWHHYAVGLAHLARARARDTLATQEAVAMGGWVKPEQFQTWRAKMLRAAGWS